MNLAPTYPLNHAEQHRGGVFPISIQLLKELVVKDHVEPAASLSRVAGLSLLPEGVALATVMPLLVGLHLPLEHGLVGVFEGGSAGGTGEGGVVEV